LLRRLPHNLPHPLHHSWIRRPQQHPLQIQHAKPHRPPLFVGHPIHFAGKNFRPFHYRQRRRVLALPQIQPDKNPRPFRKNYRPNSHRLSPFFLILVNLRLSASHPFRLPARQNSAPRPLQKPSRPAPPRSPPSLPSSFIS